MSLPDRIVRRFLAFKYQTKESKKNKIDRLAKLIRERTGISKGLAEDIADAVIRKRDLPRLALQKGWPLEDGEITGSRGSLQVSEVEAAL